MEAGAALGKIKSRTREKYLDKTPHEEHKGWGAAWRPTVGDSGGGVHKLTHKRQHNNNNGNNSKQCYNDSTLA